MNNLNKLFTHLHVQCMVAMKLFTELRAHIIEKSH